MNLNRRHFLALASTGAAAIAVPAAVAVGRTLTGWLPGTEGLTARAPQVAALLNGGGDLAQLVSTGAMLRADTVRVALHPVACSLPATVRPAHGGPALCGPGVLNSSQVLPVDGGQVRLELAQGGEVRKVVLGARGVHVVMAGSARFVAVVSEA
jgi:hypothetical protein